MNANLLIAQYVAKVTAGEDVGPGSSLYREAVNHLSAEVREAQSVIDYNVAKRTNADRWVAANGGYETALTYRTGYKLLYVYNFHTGKHAYLDIISDRILDDAEAAKAIGV